jgi:RNA polymerase sigma-70 factor (ECF subfamily)
VLQDGFLKIFEKINQFEFKGSFEGWMKKIMVNTALEKYRTQYKVINILDGMNNYEKESFEDVSDLITADELLTFIQDLSPKYRMVFNLYAIEGYSHKEISEMLDISEGTSKSNLSRARLILQEKVKSLYGSSIQTG